MAVSGDAHQWEKPPNMNKKQTKALNAKFSNDLESDDLMISTISEWYDSKHGEPSQKEVKFINHIKISDCPYCGSKEIIKDGFSKTTYASFSISPYKNSII